MILDDICHALKQSREVAIVSHFRPDGDAVGSTLALGLALRSMGKRVHLWNHDGLPERYAFLEGAELLGRVPAELPAGVDCFVCVDTGDLKRVGAAAMELFSRAPLTLNIDHHETNTHYAQINWVEGEAAACGCIIFKLLRALGAEITRPVAEALYSAISTDTGSFQFSSTTAEVMETAAALLRAGVDVGEINRHLYQEKPMGTLLMNRVTLEEMQLTAGGAISYYTLTAARRKELRVSMEDTKDLVDYIRTLKGVVISVIFEELEDGLIRISLRSKDSRFNVAQIAKQFGGGGHEMAAGIRMSGELAECRERVLEALRAAVRQES